MLTNKRMLPALDRRDWFRWNVRGLGATALMQLLLRDQSLPVQAGQVTRPDLVPRAKRAIQICLVGGLSHLDSFDYKPALETFHGKTLDSEEQPDIFFGQVGLIRKQDWTFHQRGESGQWVSDLFPHIAEMADELTIIKSLVSDSANHTPALFFANSGFQFNGFPSVGSWLSYGLGSVNESLPDYVVLPDQRGGPNGGSSNWSNGFLPAQHQGVMFNAAGHPVRDLFPTRPLAKDNEEETREFLQLLNERHLERAQDEELFASRIRSYELAARMQLSVPDVVDLSTETADTLARYGVDQPATQDAGTRCLLGRRLLEQGVRFVQIFSGGPIAGSPRCSWDAHENVLENHTAEAKRIDQPVAALLHDLKQRGLLDDTLVLFTTEFGRTPFTQSSADTVGTGRDHNRYGFSSWMAGAGVKPGISFGNTDEIGWKAAENPVTWHDFHDTVLHLFGIDHEQLTYYHNGTQRRLTNVHGNVIQQILS